ncbi:MAG: LD-carboxypeptidase [Catenulispora sp.]|nr:LD-carboxypeptidase [Catenulispora sp.]
MSAPVYPPKPRPGDAVAVLSPAAGLPGILPLPFELGLARLSADFGLRVVEYPTTRRMGSSPQDRAADLHAAFADPDIKAVIASIGGDDQIRVLPYLDRELLRANPKPFFGYSDNTNLLMFLANAGVVGYHGGTVMVEFGRPGRMHPLTEASVRAALFTRDAFDLAPARRTGTVNRRWEDPATFEAEPEDEPADAWTWHHADRVVEGRAWGGCLEIVAHLALADREIGPPEQYAGQVLFLETSEEMPAARDVRYILRSFGERGLLRQFGAVLIGRAKAWSFEQPNDAAARAEYRRAQREAILSVLTEYAPEAVAVFDVDLGHTDPQQVIPYGGTVRVDGPGRRITVQY